MPDQWDFESSHRVLTSKDISGETSNPSLMYPDEVEISLKSSEPAVDHNHEVTLEISAYLRESNFIDANTLIFHCDPVGTNYTSSYLQISFEDWSKVATIRDFLADCFSDETLTRRAMTLEVKDGVSSITPYGQSPNETEGIDEIIIEVDGERIEFLRSGSLYPYVFTYEAMIDGEPQDQNNVEKLMNFFNKIISLHPDFDPGSDDSENPEVKTFDHEKVESLLTEIVTPNSRLMLDYQKAVREYDDGEYGDAIRDIGRAGETIVKMVSLEVADEEDVPNKTGRKLNMLDKSTDGLPSFIGKTISPLWWLRNKVAHPNEYKVSKNEALYALFCFQMAVEKLVDEDIS